MVQIDTCSYERAFFAKRPWRPHGLRIAKSTPPYLNLIVKLNSALLGPKIVFIKREWRRKKNNTYCLEIQYFRSIMTICTKCELSAIKRCNHSKLHNFCIFKPDTSLKCDVINCVSWKKNFACQGKVSWLEIRQFMARRCDLSYIQGLFPFFVIQFQTWKCDVN